MEPKKYIVVATIGFTIDFVMRRVSDLGRENVSRIIAVSLDIGDESARKRVEGTFNVISRFLLGMNIQPGLQFIQSGKSAISSCRKILENAVSLSGNEGIVDLFLTGGSRVLVTSMLISALTLERNLAKKVQITSYGESFDTKFIMNVGQISAFISLGETHRQILEEIKKIGKEDFSPSDIIQKLGIPKSTFYKKLDELRESGLITRTNGRWVIAEGILDIL
ncbi:helix-turn-helix domain-containing protein [Candidatus Acidianus copahuensis]|nr:helix-turn-helix domain-containing protein [Candidatus Acidianus copahuensis]